MYADQLLANGAVAFVVHVQRPIENFAGEEMRIDRRVAAGLHETLIQIEVMASASRRLAQQSDVGVNALHIQSITLVQAAIQISIAWKCETWTGGIETYDGIIAIIIECSIRKVAIYRIRGSPNYRKYCPAFCRFYVVWRPLYRQSALPDCGRPI